MKWNNRIALLGLALAGGAVIGVALYRSRGVSAAADPPDLVTVLRVDYPLSVAAPGILEAASSVSIGPPRIPRENRFKLARMVEEGKKVSQGDFLVEFDGSDISRRLREETANLQKVQEEYQKKRSDFDIQIRDLKLQLEQAKSEQDKLDNKIGRLVEFESAIVVAETRLKQVMARQKVELLDRKLRHVTESGRLDLQISRSNETHYRNRMDALLDAMDALTVTAPVDGVVIYKRDWNNEPRQVGSFIFVLDSVLELPDLDTIRARVSVDEVDVGKVQVGQEAKITVDAIQGKTFDGKVASISRILKQAAFDRPQRIAEALIEFRDKGQKQLRPGLSARGQIQVGRYPDAIVIPLSSIQERQGRSLVQVWNPRSGDFDWREIQIKSNDGLSAVVSAGLDSKEKIRAKPKA